MTERSGRPKSRRKTRGHGRQFPRQTAIRDLPPQTQSPVVEVPPQPQQIELNLLPFAELITAEQQLMESAFSGMTGEGINFLTSQERLPIEQARRQAEMECSVLMYLYPQLLETTTFPSTYRMTRTAELSAGMSRGGISLLVGSASTTAEAAALYIVPPNKETLTRFVNMGRKPSLLEAHKSMHRDLASGKIPAMPPFLDGIVYAVEPDFKTSGGSFSKMQHSNAYFGMNIAEKPGIVPRPNSSRKPTIIALPLTLQQFASAPTTRTMNFSYILANRAEPSAFGTFQGNDRTTWQTNPNILRLLADRLTHGGSFMLSIGAGRNQIEFLQRQSLIGQCYGILQPTSSIETVRHLSGIFNDAQLVQFYHPGRDAGIASGIWGSVAAKKR